jgi:hypothetical protein
VAAAPFFGQLLRFLPGKTVIAIGAALPHIAVFAATARHRANAGFSLATAVARAHR